MLFCIHAIYNTKKKTRWDEDDKELAHYINVYNVVLYKFKYALQNIHAAI